MGLGWELVTPCLQVCLFSGWEVFPLYFTGQTWVIGHTQGNHRQSGLAMIPIPIPN